MAKRFTDTNKYKKPFIRGLQGAYKLLWDFLYHDCDHAGIWIVDFEIAQMYVGNDMPISKERAIELFNAGEKRIVEFDGGKKWFIPSFIEFQYGELSEKNRAHGSVLLLLKKNNLLNSINSDKGDVSPLQGGKEQDKDKDKDMVKVVFDEKKTNSGFNNFPVATNFNGCPEITLDSVQRLLKVTKQVDLDKHGVSELWEIFKGQELTGEKHYKSEKAVYSHFINWSKFQNFKYNAGKSGTTSEQRAKSNSKSAGAYQLLEQLKKQDGRNQP